MVLVALMVLSVSADAAAARVALEKGCAKCHGGQDANEGGFDFLFDRDALVREGFVVPARAAASRLVSRVKKGEMPPAEAWEGVPPAERRRRRAALVATLTAWVNAGAEPLIDAVAAREAPTREQLTRLMLDDLATLGTRSTTRWFIVNGGNEVALAKALNSLSWRAALVKPVPVGNALVRIDLAQLGLSRDDWEARLVPLYPFAVKTGTPDEETLARLTDSALPVLRADWFIATATRPPLYHALLRLPESEAALEPLLDVNVKEDIAKAAVLRAGFTSSGVSQNNRLLERHSTRFGAYWRSYDFASNVGARNLFERPLAFVHDGGEHIFSLPNGLFGYLLTDARGNRIDRGPTSIVRDPRRPDGAVENGLSCMGCHARGFIPKADQLGAVVKASQGSFTERERRTVALLHPEGALGVFELDTQRFAAALGELGVSLDAAEPVTAVALQYEADVGLAQAAAELGVSPGALTRALERRFEAMAPMKLGGTVKRDAFVAAFPALVKRLKLGVRLEPGVRWQGKPAPVECGLSGGDLEARAEDCAAQFPGAAVQGAFRLVARDAHAREVWLDAKRRLLWSPTQPSAQQTAAAAQCSTPVTLVEGLWFLPTARQLEEAFADGLPGTGWELLWSRDVESGHKYAAPGVAVGVAGRLEKEPNAVLTSRCISRI